jgi:hypothetical protein
MRIVVGLSPVVGWIFRTIFSVLPLFDTFHVSKIFRDAPPCAGVTSATSISPFLRVTSLWLVLFAGWFRTAENVSDPSRLYVTLREGGVPCSNDSTKVIIFSSKVIAQMTLGRWFPFLPTTSSRSQVPAKSIRPVFCAHSGSSVVIIRATSLIVFVTVYCTAGMVSLKDPKSPLYGNPERTDVTGEFSKRERSFAGLAAQYPDSPTFHVGQSWRADRERTENTKIAVH